MKLFWIVLALIFSQNLSSKILKKSHTTQTLKQPALVQKPLLALAQKLILKNNKSQNLKTNKQLQKLIQKKITNKGLKASSLGLIISPKQDSTQLVYSLNESQLFVPASLAKIPVLSALYHAYPLSYTFKTAFVSNKLIKKGILHGDLILKAGADSSFTSESLWKLVNILTRSNLKQVKGNLIIDDSLYKKEAPLSYSERSYLSPSSAASFNWNSVAFYIRPSKTLNSAAFVYANPQNSYIKVVNKVRTGTKNQIFIKRTSRTERKEIFEVKGTIDKNKREIVKYRNITNPPMWLAYNVISFLKQRNITVLGDIKKGSCKKTCHILAEWESRPFSFHSYNMMKYSSNFVTRMLVSHLPLLKGQTQGDLKQGIQQVNQYLLQNIGFKKFELVEPSGLSKQNKFSPKDLHKSLFEFQNKYYSPEILASYPLAQTEGTLKKRLDKLLPGAFVRAKTGSLYGVVGLAGWAGNKKNQYSFVFIFNGNPTKAEQAKQLFDEIVLLLANNS